MIIKKIEFIGEKSTPTKGMNYNDITFDRHQSEINHSSTGYLDWERNQGISNTSNKCNVNCHENFVQEFTPVQEANTSFIHSKTKQSTNSSIHNSRPTKKVHEVDSLSERFIFSSPLYPTYQYHYHYLLFFQ